MAQQGGFVYPKPDDQRSGNKVGWYYYIDRAQALLASDVAKLEGRSKEGMGYDFGFQSPGNMEWSGSHQMWSVVIP